MSFFLRKGSSATLVVKDECITLVVEGENAADGTRGWRGEQCAERHPVDSHRARAMAR
jgi:hypothetical protein